MTQRRALSGFLAVALAMGTCFPSAAFADGSLPSDGGDMPSDPQVATEGVCGRGAAWSYDEETKTLEIKPLASGVSGSVDVAGWAAWSTQIETVRIDSGITKISAGVFAAQSMKTVYMSASVESIGDTAFSACTSLADFSIVDDDGAAAPEDSIQLASIGKRAFAGCTALTSFLVPDSVSALDEAVFTGCTSLSRIEGAENIATIGASAFAGCTSLTDFSFSSACTSVATLAFSYTALRAVALPDSVEEVGDQAFSSCSDLVSASLPASLASLGKRAFRSCVKLESVSGLDGLTEIPDGAFEGCSSLTSVSLPAALEKIDRAAFRNCSRAFAEGVSIPASVVEVSDSAFEGCDALSQVEFLGDAPTIAATAFTDVVAKAIYPSGNTTWTKSRKKNYGGELTWYARMADGTLSLDRYRTGYVEGDLLEGSFAEAQFDDDTVGYSYSIKVAKAGPVRFSFYWDLPCSHNYFNIVVVDSSGNEVMQNDVYYSFAGDGCKLIRTQDLSAGTYRIEVTYRVGHHGQKASLMAQYSTGSPYADVSPDDWYYGAVFRASADGLMTGYGNGLFGPADSLTRAQAATILWRYFMPTASSTYAPSQATNRTGMDDVESGTFYTEAANWAVEKGIVHGVEKDGKLCFDPDALIPRSLLCVMIANAAQSLDGAHIDKADHAKFSAMPDSADVPGWAADALAWCLDEGVINGVDENGTRYVRPEAIVDRATMAQMMENALANGALSR